VDAMDFKHRRGCPDIRALFRVTNRYVGNLPPMPGVFPDYPAPVVRNAGSEREMVLNPETNKKDVV
jgi:hypothetical protein